MILGHGRRQLIKRVKRESVHKNQKLEHEVGPTIYQHDLASDPVEIKGVIKRFCFNKFHVVLVKVLGLERVQVGKLDAYLQEN